MSGYGNTIPSSPVRHQRDVELPEVGVGVKPVKDGVGRVHRDTDHLSDRNQTQIWGEGDGGKDV